MIVKQYNINNLTDIKNISEFKPDFILCFSTSTSTEIAPFLERLKIENPNINIIGCSSQNNISDVKLVSCILSLTVIKFEKSKIDFSFMNFDCQTSSYKNGISFFNKINTKELEHIVLFTTTPINGSSFLSGFQKQLPSDIKVTGGISAIPKLVNQTYIIYNGKTFYNAVVSFNIHTKGTEINYGSEGGWNSFGIERQVTKSKSNILYELDGKNALKLYKSYLGHLANKLPDIAILYPLSLRISENNAPIVRTVLNINEEDQSLIFGGNIPENSYVKLMKANVDRLISGAEKSALKTIENTNKAPSFALLVSCRGRHSVLKQLAEEEIEIVKETLGKNVMMAGFYSNGEYAPSNTNEISVLHNQTMTITTFTE